LASWMVGQMIKW